MNAELNRRLFVKKSATVLSLLPVFNALAGRDLTIGPVDDDVNVAIVGYGNGGEVLLDSAIRIPGVRIKAICDIWPWRRKIAAGRLRSLGHDINVYEDYREMLDAESDHIDCVIVATPDWMHRVVTCAALESGKHVYCEAAMSNRIKDAREMVLCQRRTGKRLQIGLQRRSNPRYIHAIENVMKKHDVLGEVTHGYAQWNRSVSPFMYVRERLRLSTETLEKYGYETMEQFLNWRWFAKYGGGPLADLCPHQLDVFMWAWGCTPSSVLAAGGNEYYDRQNNDNAMATYEFKIPGGKVKRAYCQVLSTSSRDGFYEQFLGTKASLRISEVGIYGNYVRADTNYSGYTGQEWNAFMNAGLFAKGKPALNVAPTCCDRCGPVTDDILSVDLMKPSHMPHLENFFSAVRHGTPLSCPAEVGYRVTVAALAANRAIKERRTIDFKPGDFEVV